MKAKHIRIFLILAVVLIAVWGFSLKYWKNSKEVKIGYFHGGRTMLLFRAYINNDFEKAGTPIALMTKDLNKSDYYTLSKNYDDIKTKTLLGKARGGELIDEVLSNDFDGSTPGESSFIKAVSEGASLVAVAELGHDTKDQPGHAILFRKDISIKSPQDIKGKILNSRRAGDGDKVFLEEFLTQIGLDPKKDVTIVDQVADDQTDKGLLNGTFDGGYYHLMSVIPLVENNNAYIYRKFDWVNPEMSQALLVFHKDFVKDHPDQVKNIVKAYMQRIKYEHSLSKEERLKDPGKGFLYGLQMEEDFQGMNLPQYNFPPLVRENLLNEMQDLLIKHNVLSKKVDLSPFIDNHFVEEVYKELK